MSRLVNKAKAISAERLEVNLKNKLEEMVKTGRNWKKQEEIGRNRETEGKKTHGKQEETTGRHWKNRKETGRNKKTQKGGKIVAES